VVCVFVTIDLPGYRLLKRLPDTRREANTDFTGVHHHFIVPNRTFETYRPLHGPIGHVGLQTNMGFGTIVSNSTLIRSALQPLMLIRSWRADSEKPARLSYA